MKTASTILTLILCAASIAHGDQRAILVYVGGDVPKPGPVNFEDEGMTIDAAMTGVGMDLRPFYSEGRNGNDGPRCPIRVAIIRQGKKKTYDPSTDARVLRAMPLEPYDTVDITDMRQHSKKIEIRKQRIERMLELGSTEIGDELLALAALRHEHEEWRGSEAGEEVPDSDEFLKKEAARLVKEGKGQKIISLLDLRLSALRLEGLGQAHPVVQSPMNLIRIFRKLVAD